MDFKRNISNDTNKGIIVLLLFQILFFLGHVIAHGLSLDWNHLYNYSDALSTAPLFLMYLLCRIGSIGYFVGLGFFGIKDSPRTLFLFLISSFLYYALALYWADNVSLSGLFVHPFDLFHSAPLIIVIILYPIVSQYINTKAERGFMLLVIIAFLYYFVYRLVLNKNDHSVDINVVYFLIGILSAKYSDKIVKYSGKLGLIALLLLLLFAFIVPNIYIKYVANYNNCLYVVIAVSMCIRLSNFGKSNNRLVRIMTQEIGLPYIGIYLLTDNHVFIKSGCPFFLSMLLDNWLLFLCSSPLFILFIVIAHRILSFILSALYDICFLNYKHQRLSND